MYRRGIGSVRGYSGALPLDGIAMEEVLKEQLPKAFEISKVALQRGLDLVRAG